MDVIPVLDLAAGVAVHARAGDRARYEPVRSVLAPEAGGDPVALLRGVASLGAAECYVADLDAIQGRAIQRTVLRELATLQSGFAGSLLVDAGTHRPAGAIEVLSCGAGQVVVGLESLRAFAELAGIVDLVGAARVIFSLDLRHGAPVLHPGLQDAAGTAPEAMSLAAGAVEAGVSTLLVLDIGRVGTGCGVDVGLMEAMRRRFPSERLLAGGGVLTRRDLERLRDAGCDGVLVASALHAGRIGAADVAALGGVRPGAGPQSEARASR